MAAPGTTHTLTLEIKGDTHDAEAKIAKLGLVAHAQGKNIGDAFNEGTSKAGHGFERLGKSAAAWAIPFGSAMNTVGKHLDDATAKSGKLHDNLSALGKVTAVGGVAGLAAVAGEALKYGEAFETAQAKVQGATGQSAKQVASLTKAFQATAGSSQESGQKLEAAYAAVAGQLKNVEGHALSNAQAVKFMATTEELSRAAGIGLAGATEAVAKTLQAFHLHAKDAAQVSNELFTVSKALNLPVEGVATAVDKLHGRLGILTPNLREVATLMLETGHQGITGTRGVMLVNTAFQTLIGGGKTVQAMLSQLNVHVFDQNHNFVGLASVISQLSPKLAGLNEQQKLFAERTLFGKGAAQVLGSVIEHGTGAWQRDLATITQHNAVQKAAEAQAKTFHAQVEKLKATLETLAGSLGQALIPKVTALAHALSDGVHWLEKHKDAAKILAGVIGSVLGLAVATFAYDTAKGFVTAVKGMVTEILSHLIPSLRAVGPQATATAGEVEGAEVGMVGATDTAAASMKAALLTSGIGAALVALGVAAVALEGKWKKVWEAITKIVIEAANKVVDAINKMKEAAETVATLGINQLTGPLTPNVPQFGMPTGPGAQSIPPYHGIGGSQAAFLNQLGLPMTVAAGLAGNFAQEGVASDVGASGLGIAQWTRTGGRREKAEAFIQAKGLPVTSERGQLEYADWELRTSMHGAYTEAARARTPQEAARILSKAFEMPAEATANLPHREQAAGEAAQNAGLAALEEAHGRGGRGGRSHQEHWTEGLNPLNGHIEWHSAAEWRRIHTQHALQTHQRTAQHIATGFGIPMGVAGMLRTAESLVGTPYVEGGGHQGFNETLAQLKKLGLDCSGFVSQVLHAGGILTQPLDTTRLPGVLQRGPGQYVTVADKPLAGQSGHTFIEILGKWFEEGGRAASARAKLISGAQAGQELAGGGFQLFHPGGALNVHQLLRLGGVPSSQATAGSSIFSSISAAEAANEKRAQAEQAKRLAALNALKASGEGKLQKLESDMQSGTVKTLEKLLGYHSETFRSVPLYGGHGQIVGHERIPATLPGITGSVAEKQFNELIEKLRATHDKGLMQLATKLVQEHAHALTVLNKEIAADQNKAIAEKLALETSEMKDQTALQEKMANRMVEAVKDAMQAIVDALSASATLLHDAGQSISDAFTALATNIKDVTAEITQRYSGEAKQIADRSKTETDKIAERGLYGLNLLAQQQTVGLDEMTTGFDANISTSEQAINTARTSTDQATASVQAYIDAVQTREDTTIAAAKQNVDAVTQNSNAAIQNAEVNVANITKKVDKEILVAATEREHASTETQAQQNIAEMHAKRVEEEGHKAIAEAEATLATTKNAGSSMVAQAQASLSQAEGHAGVAEAEAQNALANAQGQAAVVLAAAERTLAEVRGQGEVAEAQQQAIVAKTQALAQTQYAGSGLTINIEGLNPTDGAVVATEVAWALRTQVPA